MAEEDNRLNPATGISDFANKSSKGKAMAEDMINAGERRSLEEQRKYSGRYIEIQPKGGVKIEARRQLSKEQMMQIAIKAGIVQQKSAVPVKKSFFGRSGFKRTSKPLKDRLKVLRFSNNLERMRLKNQIQRLKLQRTIENLRKKGKLNQVITTPVLRQPLSYYPAYATSEIIGDIDSVFLSPDFGHADGNIWGNEAYYDEKFYGEDYYGTEFDGDVWAQLHIKPIWGVSPLLW
jgi:hypothetical protein